MSEVTITGLTRITDPKPNKGGSTVLAWFDCTTRGISLHGCAFVRTARHGLTVWAPKLDNHQNMRCTVAIVDEKLRTEMVRQVQETYRVLGGTDGEWIRHDEADAEEAAERYAEENGPEAAERKDRSRDAYARRNNQRDREKPNEIKADDGVQWFIANG